MQFLVEDRVHREQNLKNPRRENRKIRLAEQLRNQDLRNEVEGLKASFDVVNQTVKRRPGWDAYYQEFLQFYERKAALALQLLPATR